MIFLNVRVRILSSNDDTVNHRRSEWHRCEGSSGLSLHRQAARHPGIFPHPHHALGARTPTDATRRTQVTCLRPQSMSPVLRTPEQHGHPSTPRSDEHTSRSLKFKKKSPNQRELRVTPRAFTTHTSVSASTPAAPTEPWLTPTEGTYQICCILPGLELRISFKCLPLITGSLKKARQGAIPGGLIALCDTLQGAAYGFPSQALPSVPRS